VDPLREDVGCLGQVNADSQQNNREFRDPAESYDPVQPSSLHEFTSLHIRLSDLEAAFAVQSQKSAEFQQHLCAVEQFFSQEMQTTRSTVNGEVALVTQAVEILQKEYVVVQDQTNKLTIKVEAFLSKELVAMKNSNLATGSGVVVAPPVPSSCQPVEGQLNGMPQDSELEKTNTGNHEMAAGSLMSRISALESVVTRQLGALKKIVAQSHAPWAVPMTLQARSTSASKPRSASQMGSAPASVPATRGSASIAVPSRMASPAATRGSASVTIPSQMASPAATPRAIMPAASASVSFTASGKYGASKDEVKVLRFDEGGMNVRRAMPDSVHLQASMPHEQCSQVRRATLLVSPRSPRSAAMPSVPASPLGMHWL